MSTSFINIIFLSAFAFLHSIQVFVVCAWAGRFFRDQSELLRMVFPESARFVGNDQFSFWTIVFVVICVAGQLITFAICRRTLQDAGFLRRWRSYAAVEGVLTFLLLSAVFKMILYDDRPQLATYAFYVVAGLTFLNKIFWPEIKNALTGMYATLTDPKNTLIFRRLFNALFVVFIFLLIFVPDPESAVARIFIGEQFHHWDMFITGTGWAYTMGEIVDIDVISRYGLGMPIIVSQLTKIFGGYNHVNLFLVFMWVCLIY